MDIAPWVTFCMSTYRRPKLLQEQLGRILQQTFNAFHIVVSDNDPDASAKEVAAGFNDSRIRYFHNEENLGMIRSFNKSIERSETTHIVMITDDDPVQPNFLQEMYSFYLQHPDLSIYCGCIRNHVPPGHIEIIDSKHFIAEILDMKKTPVLLWSSCVVKKEAAIEVGKIPDFGGPHLADHAFLSMAGSKHGGLLVNKMYSHFTIHETNFSKSNIYHYPSSCLGFYNLMTAFAKDNENLPAVEKIVIEHLGQWFITNMFNLKKHYTLKKNEVILNEINQCITEILRLPFMERFKLRVTLKNMIFNIKRHLNLL